MSITAIVNDDNSTFSRPSSRRHALTRAFASLACNTSIAAVFIYNPIDEPDFYKSVPLYDRLYNEKPKVAIIHAHNFGKQIFSETLIMCPLEVCIPTSASRGITRKTHSDDYSSGGFAPRTEFSRHNVLYDWIAVFFLLFEWLRGLFSGCDCFGDCTWMIRAYRFWPASKELQVWTRPPAVAGPHDLPDAVAYYRNWSGWQLFRHRFRSDFRHTLYVWGLAWPAFAALWPVCIWSAIAGHWYGIPVGLYLITGAVVYSTTRRYFVCHSVLPSPDPETAAAERQRQDRPSYRACCRCCCFCCLFSYHCVRRNCTKAGTHKRTTTTTAAAAVDAVAKATRPPRSTPPGGRPTSEYVRPSERAYHGINVLFIVILHPILALLFAGFLLCYSIWACMDGDNEEADSAEQANDSEGEDSDADEEAQPPPRRRSDQPDPKAVTVAGKGPVAVAPNRDSNLH
jgi:hypothetical protein